MNSIEIRAVDCPQFLSSSPYTISSNLPAPKADKCLPMVPVFKQHSPYPFYALIELQSVINAYQDRIRVLRCEGEADEITLNPPIREGFLLVYQISALYSKSGVGTDSIMGISELSGWAMTEVTSESSFVAMSRQLM